MHSVNCRNLRIGIEMIVVLVCGMFLWHQHRPEAADYFLKCLTSLGPSAIGIAVAIIARQQWHVARNKLRLDLFDRRYKVFDATREFLSAIFRKVNFEDFELFEFDVGTSDAGFLFGSEVVDYLKKIRTTSLEMRIAGKQAGRPSLGEAERSRLNDLETEKLTWLTKQHRESSKVFDPYLGFSHVR